MNETFQTILKPYNIKELAELYGMSKKTIRTWLRPHAQEIGPRQGRYYTILQVKIIFEKIGMPQKGVTVGAVESNLCDLTSLRHEAKLEIARCLNFGKNKIIIEAE